MGIRIVVYRGLDFILSLLKFLYYDSFFSRCVQVCLFVWDSPLSSNLFDIVVVVQRLRTWEKKVYSIFMWLSFY